MTAAGFKRIIKQEGKIIWKSLMKIAEAFNEWEKKHKTGVR